MSFVTLVSERTNRTKRRNHCAQWGARVVVDHAAVKVADRIFCQFPPQNAVVDWRQTRAVRSRDRSRGCARALRQVQSLNTARLFARSARRRGGGVHGVVVGVKQATRILARKPHGRPR
jgi:hypothetical protein